MTDMKTKPLSTKKDSKPQKKGPEPIPEIFKNTTNISFSTEQLLKIEEIKRLYGFRRAYDLGKAFLSLFTIPVPIEFSEQRSIA